MKDKVTDLLFIALVLIAFIVGCNWNKPDPCTPEIIPGPVDTVIKYEYIKDSSAIKPKTKHSYPVPVTEMPCADSSVDNTGLLASDCDSIRLYEGYYADSTVTVRDSVHGVLLRQWVDYRKNTITIEHHDTIVRAPKWEVFGGVVVSGVSVVPNLILRREKSYVGAGFDVINKTPMLEYGVRIIKSKK